MTVLLSKEENDKVKPTLERLPDDLLEAMQIIGKVTDQWQQNIARAQAQKVLRILEETCPHHHLNAKDCPWCYEAIRAAVFSKENPR